MLAVTTNNIAHFTIPSHRFVGTRITFRNSHTLKGNPYVANSSLVCACAPIVIPRRRKSIIILLFGICPFEKGTYIVLYMYIVSVQRGLADCSRVCCVFCIFYSSRSLSYFRRK